MQSRSCTLLWTSVLQCVAVCCSVLQYVLSHIIIISNTVAQLHTFVDLSVAVCCSVLQCVAVCCSVLQYVLTHIIIISKTVAHTFLDLSVVMCSNLLQRVLQYVLVQPIISVNTFLVTFFFFLATPHHIQYCHILAYLLCPHSHS